MAKFKVKVIEHLLKNNQIAKAGDIVDEENLINYEHSVKGGFVVPVDETEEDDDDIETAEEKAEREKQEAIDANVKQAMDLKKSKLIDFAEANGLQFDKDANKDVIQEQVKSQITENSIFPEDE